MVGVYAGGVVMQIARIRVGAIVFSDHSFPVWGEHIGVGQEDRMFVFTPLDTNHNRYDLRAWGFGLATKQYQEGAYGNGSLFVSKEDIIFSDEEAWDSIHKPAIPIKEDKRLKAGYYLVVGDGYSDIVKVSGHEKIHKFGVFQECSKHTFTGNPHWYKIDLRDLLTHLGGV
jgi:hypothetical protein